MCVRRSSFSERPSVAPSIDHRERICLVAGASRRDQTDAGTEPLPGCDGSVQKGDTLVIETPGGAGWGDPSHRDRYLLETDVAEGIISRDAATRLYGPRLAGTRR